MSVRIDFENQDVKAPVNGKQIPPGAKVAHINVVTGGIFYMAAPDTYEGPCSVSDISVSDGQEIIAVLPNRKEAHMLAFIAVMPDSGFSKVLVETTDNPVTHESYIDWL